MTTYTFEIIDGGDSPLFRISPADAPHETVFFFLCWINDVCVCVVNLPLFLC